MGHTKNLGPIGSAVLTFIGYKQTDKPNLYIDIFQTYSRHPGEPGSIPFSLKPDLSPHAPHHPHPLQDKEHPEDYSTDPLITSEDHLKEYDLDYVDEEEIDQFNEIEDEEEYDDEGLGKDQEVEAAEPNRIAKLQIIVIIKKKIIITRIKKRNETFQLET